MRRLAARIIALAALALGTGATLPTSVGADTGYRGPSYAVTPPGTTPNAPSADKPQNKLWFHDGRWWGILFNPSAGTDGEFRIHRFDAPGQAWIDTGMLVDERNDARADALVEGLDVYVASVVPEAPGTAQLRHYHYDPAARTYSAVTGSPVPIDTPSAIETISLARDSQGRLWTAYESGGTAYVSHTAAGGTTFGTPFAVPTPGPEATTLRDDDIAAVVSYGPRVGVMWSNQEDDTMHFASLHEGAWTHVPASSGTDMADDHINLKSLHGDPAGMVFAAVKTSRTDAEGPLVQLLVLRAAGWTSYTFGTVANDHTRPIVLIDSARRRLHMLATSPTVGGGSIYHKETSLDDISFAPGLGSPFIQMASDPGINNATSTRQDLATAPGALVLAADDSTDRYLHNLMALPDLGQNGGGGVQPGPPPPPALPAAPAPPAVPAPPPPPAVDLTRPTLTRFRMKPSVFRPFRRGGSVATASRGATVVFRLDERATVRFTVERVRLVRGRKRYTRLRGAFTRPGVAGANRFRFTGRVRRRALRPGRYRLAAVATDRSGNRSAPSRIPFRIRSR